MTRLAWLGALVVLGGIGIWALAPGFHPAEFIAGALVGVGAVILEFGIER